MKILLIAGHGAGDPGACGNGFREADLTREVVALLKPKLAEICEVDVADTSKNWYEYLRHNSFNFKGYDYVLEVHFNAYNTSAHGTEIIVTPAEQNTGVEAAILSQMCNTLGFTNRGIKRRNDLLVIKTVKSQGVSSALLETCFIDNAADMHTYTHKKNELIDAIVNGIAEGFGLTRKAPARHWAAIAHDKLKERKYVTSPVWENYDGDIPAAHALALLDNISGRWASEEADKSIHEAQPIVISLCGKGIIKDKVQWIDALIKNETLSKARCLALFDSMTGGMRPAYVNRDTDHWGRNCLDSLCDKGIIKTPHAWDDNFESATTYGLFMALSVGMLGI